MNQCVNNADQCLIRGDNFTLDLGLVNFPEVLANPTDFEGRMVFRETQNDNEIPYLTLIVTPELADDPMPNAPEVFLRFAATPTQTSALPDWNIVYYVELRTVPADTIVQRLLQGDVDVSD